MTIGLLMKIMQKVCFFNTAQAWGGGEKWHFEIACRMHREGVPVLVLTRRGSALHRRVCEAAIPCRLVRVSKMSLFNPFKVMQLARLLKRENVGTVILNMSSDLKAGAPAARLAGVPNIIYRRGSAIRIRNSFYNRYIFKHLVSWIIANSEETRRTVLQSAPGLFPADRIKVIYNGICLEDYTLPGDTARPASAADDVVVIGNLGRLVRQKAQHLLADVALKLRERGCRFRIRIGGDGPLYSQINAYTQQLGVAEHFEFVGYVNDPRAFMNAIEVFVLPSRWEGFGYVLTEAMACGKPVVAFAHSSNPEVVVSGETGILVPPGDVDAFAAAVAKLAADPALRGAMGAAGRKRVEERFTFDRCYQELESFLSGLNEDHKAT